MSAAIPPTPARLPNAAVGEPFRYIPPTFQSYWQDHGMQTDQNGRMVVPDGDGMRMWYPGIGRRPTNPELLQFAYEGDMQKVPSDHMPGNHGGRRRNKKTRKAKGKAKAKTKGKAKKSRKH
jgi:hypothetical protein